MCIPRDFRNVTDRVAANDTQESNRRANVCPVGFRQAVRTKSKRQCPDLVLHAPNPCAAHESECRRTGHILPRCRVRGLRHASTGTDLDEKRNLYQDGFIVLKDVVPSELTWAAKRRINIFAGRDVGDSSSKGPMAPSRTASAACALDTSPRNVAQPPNRSGL